MHYVSDPDATLLVTPAGKPIETASHPCQKERLAKCLTNPQKHCSAEDGAIKAQEVKMEW